MESLIISTLSLILVMATIAYITYSIGYTQATFKYQKELNKLYNEVKLLSIKNTSPYGMYAPPPPVKSKPKLHLFKSDSKGDEGMPK